MSAVAMALLAGALAGCGGREPPAPAAARAPAQTSRVAEPARRVRATGVVQSVDAASGKVTIAQAANAEMGWPAYSSDFRASSAALRQVAEGSRVTYEVEVGSGSQNVIDLRRQ